MRIHLLSILFVPPVAAMVEHPGALPEAERVGRSDAGVLHVPQGMVCAGVCRARNYLALPMFIPVNEEVRILWHGVMLLKCLL